MAAHFGTDADHTICRPSGDKSVQALNEPLFNVPETHQGLGQTMLGPDNERDAASVGEQSRQNILFVPMSVENPNPSGSEIPGRFREGRKKTLLAFGDDAHIDSATADLLGKASRVQQNCRKSQLLPLRQVSQEGRDLNFGPRPEVTRSDVANCDLLSAHQLSRLCLGFLLNGADWAPR
jgi:hypothetical protein